MTDDTAQPYGAAETDPVATAADAFKVSLGQADPRPRDDSGRFASEQQPATEGEDETDEIEVEGAADAEPDTESDTDTDDGDEAADDAQPDAVDMPVSWAKEDAEIWSALPPEAQAKIAEREGQRDAAINQKFQAAANLRQQNEAIIRRAAETRDTFAQLAEMTLNVIKPVEPPLSMLDYNSDDYDPDQYHMKRAQFEQQMALVNNLSARQREAAQAREQDEKAHELARYNQINASTYDAFARSVPDIADQAKAPAVLKELIDYAVAAGAPEEMFQTPTTALEWHILYKAREYDKLQAATKRVGQTPAPEPSKAQPAVRPGVTTTRSATKQAQMAKSMKRLSQSGSIEDGAAIWKQVLKG